ncbi:hypothetical protein BSKO_11980 [Bryopsis sp. KO-2023]|nr:hypothetical protein BSKO_11980 [Bryopsis sp. KO-2023]
MVANLNKKTVFILSLLAMGCSGRDREEATCGIERAGTEDVRIFLTNLDNGALAGAPNSFDVVWGSLSGFDFLNLVSLRDLTDGTRAYFAPDGMSSGENACEVTETFLPVVAATTKGRKILSSGPCFPTLGCGPRASSSFSPSSSANDTGRDGGRKRVGLTLCIQECCSSFFVAPGLASELFELGQRRCDSFG